MGDAGGVASGHAVGVRAKVQTRPARSFWWDREPPAEADVLRAVIFDADSALADSGRDTSKTGLIDSVMSLFCAGIWVGVVSTRRRERVETLVRHVVGDGLVETIVTVDDLADIGAGHDRDADLYRLVLWELGITPRDALAVTGSAPGLRAAVAAGLPVVVVTASDSVDQPLVGAADVRARYDGPRPLLAADCQRAHRLWSNERSRVA
jgi:beta-phosphoglucomutase-like phosphatase (HAD superfamily)